MERRQCVVLVLESVGAVLLQRCSGQGLQAAVDSLRGFQEEVGFLQVLRHTFPLQVYVYAFYVLRQVVGIVKRDEDALGH